MFGVSLTALAVATLTGLCGGYVFLRRWAKARRSRVLALGSGTAKSGVDSRGSAELRVGDVIGIGDQEYWLTSGYALHEAGHALALVFSAETSRLVLTLGPRGVLYLGHEVSLLLPSELPARLEHAARSFSLKSRVPVDVEALGSGHEPPKAALWGCYEAGDDETLWVLCTPEQAHAILTRRVAQRDIFRWGSAGEA